MRIGIITFHASHNFGSALQAYAMQAAICSLGHEAIIIDYLSKDQENYKLFVPLHPRRAIRVLGNFRGLYNRKRAFENFSSNFLRLTANHYDYKNESRLIELQRDYDCFVCGSDQIWNLDCTEGVNGPFFLSFAGERRRVAYAPSLAHTAFKPVNFDKRRVAELLADFDYLSVREAETVPLFQSLVDKSIDVVLDPTLLLGAADYEGVVEGPPVDGDYIFMYLLRSCPELVDSTIDMAVATDKKVVYVSEKDLPIPNGINLFGIGPSGFLSAIVHADVVLANSFHAAVFSVIFHKSFRVFATDRSGARMRNLLGDLGMGERCVDCRDSSAIAGVDWSDVDARLDALRQHSLDYLRGALA